MATPFIICLEHGVALALPLGERVLLAHGPQVDALAEVVHLLEVLAPLLVDDPQHHLALDLAHDRLAELLLALLVVVDGLVHEQLVELVGRRALGQALGGDARSARRCAPRRRGPRGPTPRCTPTRSGRR